MLLIYILVNRQNILTHCTHFAIEFVPRINCANLLDEYWVQQKVIDSDPTNTEAEDTLKTLDKMILKSQCKLSLCSAMVDQLVVPRNNSLPELDYIVTLYSSVK